MRSKQVLAVMLLFTLVFGTLANASPTFIQTDGKDYSNSSYGIQNGRSNNNADDKVVDCTNLNFWLRFKPLSIAGFIQL